MVAHRPAGVADLRSSIAAALHLPVERLARLLEATSALTLPPRTVLRRPDHVSRECAVLIEGAAEAIRPTGDRLALGPGAYIGEPALLGSMAWGASVISTTDVLLLTGSVTSFAALLEQDDDVRDALLAASPWLAS